MAAVASIVQPVLKPLLKLGLSCIGEKHRVLVLDLCFQLAFRPSCPDNVTSLKILLSMLKSDDMKEHFDIIGAQLRDYVDAPKTDGDHKSHFFLYCSSLMSRTSGLRF